MNTDEGVWDLGVLWARWNESDIWDRIRWPTSIRQHENVEICCVFPISYGTKSTCLLGKWRKISSSSMSSSYCPGARIVFADTPDLPMSQFQGQKVLCAKNQLWRLWWKETCRSVTTCFVLSWSCVSEHAECFLFFLLDQLSLARALRNGRKADAEERTSEQNDRRSSAQYWRFTFRGLASGFRLIQQKACCV